MSLKTFNLDEQAYKEFSKYCKKNGISMSKKVENFIKSEIEKIKTGSGAKSKKFFEIKHEKLDPATHSMGKYC